MTTTYAVRLEFDPAHKDSVLGTLYELEVSSFQEGSADAATEVADEDSLIICYFPDINACTEFEHAFVQAAAVPVTVTHSEFATAQWQDAWKEFAQPVEISSRLLICPTWKEQTPKPGQITLLIDPSNAFGSGSHETTQLCLRLIDQTLAADPSIKSLLDVGCGSGILAIAAARLSPQLNRIAGVDLDDQIIQTANSNAVLNGTPLIQFSASPLCRIAGQNGGDRFDIVVANILSSVLDALWDDLVAAVAPQGRLILSGILIEEVKEFTRRHQLNKVDCTRLGEWAALSVSAQNLSSGGNLR